MKKVLAMALSLILTFLMTACGRAEKTTYRDILLGGEAFRYNGELITLDAFMEEEAEFAEIFSFAMLDMDGDGDNEVLLQIIAPAGDQSGYLVLHREKKQIFGYRFPMKYITHVKADGSFYRSDAVEGYAATLSFDGEDCTVVKQFYGTGQDFMRYEFVVDGKEVSGFEYDEIYTAWFEKPDAQWHTFTEEAIEEQFPET